MITLFFQILGASLVVILISFTIFALGCLFILRRLYHTGVDMELIYEALELGDGSKALIEGK